MNKRALKKKRLRTTAIMHPMKHQLSFIWKIKLVKTHQEQPRLSASLGPKALDACLAWKGPFNKCHITWKLWIDSRWCSVSCKSVWHQRQHSSHVKQRLISATDPLQTLALYLWRSQCKHAGLGGIISAVFSAVHLPWIGVILAWMFFCTTIMCHRKEPCPSQMEPYQQSQAEFTKVFNNY